MQEHFKILLFFMCYNKLFYIFFTLIEKFLHGLS